MPHTSSQTFLRKLDKKPWTAADKKGAQASRLFHPEHTAKMAVPPSYFTPKSIVSLIVETIEPYQDRVDDPPMGSGGFFVRNTRPSGVRFAKRCRASARGVVQSERFIEEHGGTIGDIMVSGQDQWAWGAHLRRAQRTRRVRLRRKQPNQCNPTTWRLAAMNMVIRGLPRHSATTPGIDFDFGKEPADTFTRDQHPDLRADFVMANPPFNIKEWWNGKLEGDARWNRSEAELASHAKFYKIRGKSGTPPQGNANFAWVQHMLQNLSRQSAATTDHAPNGLMALLLANGSMSSNSSGEGNIRRALIEADLVETATRECAPLKTEGIPQVASEARDNMVALPGQLFTNTQIPACIWFLTKNKTKRSRPLRKSRNNACSGHSFRMDETKTKAFSLNL